MDWTEYTQGKFCRVAEDGAVWKLALINRRYVLSFNDEVVNSDPSMAAMMSLAADNDECRV